MTQTEIKCYKLCDKIKDKRHTCSQFLYEMNKIKAYENENDILKAQKCDHFVETKACLLFTRQINQQQKNHNHKNGRKVRLSCAVRAAWNIVMAHG